MGLTSIRGAEQSAPLSKLNQKLKIMAKYLRIYNGRDEYRASLLRTMTVGELIEYLEQYDRDLKVIISNDFGWTYGRVNDDVIEEVELDDED